ncbi:MAG: hypothetical protein GX362_06300 [Methanosarcinaceae archaeon]|nr:hypothetical protein [Methanosarcinaceae archaeon]
MNDYEIYFLEKNRIILYKNRVNRCSVYQLFPLEKDMKINIGMCNYCTEVYKTHSIGEISKGDEYSDLIDILNKNKKDDKDFRIIIAYCKKCDKYTLNIYTKEWEWINEILLKDVKNSDYFKNVFNKIDVNVYKNIISTPVDFKKNLDPLVFKFFSQAEIKTILNKMEGKNVRRQYLYRVRKKAEKLDEIAGIKIII